MKRARIRGSYDGKPFLHEDAEGSEGWGNVDKDNPGHLYRFWWEDGNFSCDCNRARFVDPDLDLPCGYKVHIETIEAMDGDFETLVLGECSERGLEFQTITPPRSDSR